jgi:hypothetical protein
VAAGRSTPNKATSDVLATLASLGCDPIEGMARIAMDTANAPELRETVAAKRSNAAIAAKDDATGKSYALRFGTGDYAQCRENLVNQREANRRALIMAPP